jgi:desulfoferrodoxin-like iron-binding protein
LTSNSAVGYSRVDEMKAMFGLKGFYNRGGEIMAVEKVGEKYRCDVCGNEVTVTKAGGGELVCCGQPMEKISG